MGLSRSIAGHRATVEAVREQMEQQFAAAERAEALLRKPNIWRPHNREAQQALDLLVRLVGGHAALLEQADAGEVVLEGVLSKLCEWRGDPVAFVREVLRAEPDAWQERVLSAAATSPRMVETCAKGPGKTTTDVWRMLWYMATRPHARVAVTSGSEKQLFDTLWPELAKWYGRSFLLGSWFAWGKTRLSHKQAPDTWWCSARSWSRSADEHTAGESLAGLHEKYAMVVLDEAATMPESLLVTAEAVLATGGETRLIVSGNPSTTSGALYRAAVTDRAHWYVTHVTGDPDDPERSPRVDVEWARSMIERYGRDSAFVEVNVLGQFPTKALGTLLSLDEVLASMSRTIPESSLSGHALVLGVDVARMGLDATVFCLRQGLKVLDIQLYRGLTNMEVADRVVALVESRKVDETFIDAGAGSGVIDRCRQLNFYVQEIPFSGAATDRRFLNKRAQMFWEMAEWVRTYGVLPHSPELAEELTAFSYTYKRDHMQVIDKDDLKKTLGRSPDRADALALTFAWPVAPRRRPEQTLYSRDLHAYSYDPWTRGLGQPYSADDRNYDIRRN
jgi:hypothetical protein